MGKIEDIVNSIKEGLANVNLEHARRALNSALKKARIAADHGDFEQAQELMNRAKNIFNNLTKQQDKPATEELAEQIKAVNDYVSRRLMESKQVGLLEKAYQAAMEGKYSVATRYLRRAQSLGAESKSIVNISARIEASKLSKYVNEIAELREQLEDAISKRDRTEQRRILRKIRYRERKIQEVEEKLEEMGYESRQTRKDLNRARKTLAEAYSSLAELYLDVTILSISKNRYMSSRLKAFGNYLNKVKKLDQREYRTLQRKLGERIDLYEKGESMPYNIGSIYQRALSSERGNELKKLIRSNHPN